MHTPNPVQSVHIELILGPAEHFSERLNYIESTRSTDYSLSATGRLYAEPLADYRQVSLSLHYLSMFFVVAVTVCAAT